MEKIKNGEITLANKEQIANSSLSEDKKEELYKILANQNTNQEKQPITNYLSLLISLSVISAVSLLFLTKFLQNKIKKLFKYGNKSLE